MRFKEVIKWKGGDAERRRRNLSVISWAGLGSSTRSASPGLTRKRGGPVDETTSYKPKRGKRKKERVILLCS